VRQVHWGWIGAIAALMLTIGYIGINNIPAWWRGWSAGISDPSASQMAEKSRAEQAASAEAEAEQRADEQAKADEDRKRAEAEAKRRADEQAKAEEDRKQAEAKRRADEQAKIEADRRQAEAEAKRRADEEAARRDPALSVKPGSGQSFRDRLADGQPCPMCPEMVVAPVGSFTMGSPPGERGRDDGEEQVRVTIARPFAVGKFAVTFDQWDACVAEGGCNRYRPADEGWGRGNRPVIRVNWGDAKAYIVWLSGKTGKTYRLLSEAEREYVTRAGTTTPFWWGSSISTSQANYNDAGGLGGEFRQQTVPVDSFEANHWGLFNVHGNVLDWTEDCWNESNQGNPGNGSARATGDCSRRVVRGGSWLLGLRYLRAANRGWGTTDYRYANIGFRLARTLNP
jgi:formylglycine-generating enzyme required for sulfatase activity